MYLIYINENYQFKFVPIVVTPLGTYEVTIQENNFVLGVNLNGVHYYLPNIMTELEVLSNNTSINFSEVPLNEFSKTGRTLRFELVDLMTLTFKLNTSNNIANRKSFKLYGSLIDSTTLAEITDQPIFLVSYSYTKNRKLDTLISTQYPDGFGRFEFDVLENNHYFIIAGDLTDLGKQLNITKQSDGTNPYFIFIDRNINENLLVISGGGGK